MKRHNFFLFIAILSIGINFTSSARYDAVSYFVNAITDQYMICGHTHEEPIEIIRMQTPRLQYLYFESFLGVEKENTPDIPENYFCVIYVEKNRVQEARRNVDEHNTNICSGKR